MTSSLPPTRVRTQGGAADIMTLAMLSIARSPKLKTLGYKLLLQVSRANLDPP